MVNINSLFRDSESMGPCEDECYYEIILIPNGQVLIL